MYYNTMEHQISLTGITTLTESRYKQRHSTGKDIVQVPKQGFRSLKQYKAQNQHEFQPKKRTTRRHRTTTGSQKKPKILYRYIINKKQVTHRIRNYVNSMKGEKMLYFWTVSFPLGTQDDIAYILLNKWLTRLRQEKMLKEYLWIAERQQNKTIHFHMVINQKMDVKRANKFMRASIMHSINNQEIQYNRQKATRYNGVDIAKDRKTKRVINFAKQKKQKSLSNYLTKYVTKNNEAFTHLAWHSSRGYSNLIISVRLTSDELTRTNLLSQINTEKPLISTYFTHYQWKGQTPQKVIDYLTHCNQVIKTLLYVPDN